MAFKTWEVQHSFQSFESAAAEDRFVNVWHIYNEVDMGDIGSGIPAGIASAFHQFYEDCHDGQYYSTIVQGSGRTVKFYDVTTDGPPASQFTSTAGPFLVPGDNDDSLPQEVAACLSFEGFLLAPEHAAGTTSARARRRGRVYLGPFSVNALSTFADEGRISRLAVGAQNAFLGAYQALVDALLLLDTFTGTWSKQDALFTKVHRAWVDNAWDTQRRRGAKAYSTFNAYRATDDLSWEP